VEKLWYKSI